MLYFWQGSFPSATLRSMPPTKITVKDGNSMIEFFTKMYLSKQAFEASTFGYGKQLYSCNYTLANNYYTTTTTSPVTSNKFIDWKTRKFKKRNISGSCALGPIFLSAKACRHCRWQSTVNKLCKYPKEVHKLMYAVDA